MPTTHQELSSHSIQDNILSTLEPTNQDKVKFNELLKSELANLGIDSATQAQYALPGSFIESTPLADFTNQLIKMFSDDYWQIEDIKPALLVIYFGIVGRDKIHDIFLRASEDDALVLARSKDKNLENKMTKLEGFLNEFNFSNLSGVSDKYGSENVKIVQNQIDDFLYIVYSKVPVGSSTSNIKTHLENMFKNSVDIFSDLEFNMQSIKHFGGSKSSDFVGMVNDLKIDDTTRSRTPSPSQSPSLSPFVSPTKGQISVPER